MRIAFINNFFNPGGSTKTAYALAKEFYVDHKMQFYGFWDGDFRQKFEELGNAHIMKSKGFDYGSELIESIYNFDPDVIHVFIPGSQNPSYFSKLPTRSKKFLTVLCNQKLGFNSDSFEKIFFISKFGSDFSGVTKNSLVVRPGFDYSFKMKEQGRTPRLARISAFCPSKLISHTVQAAHIFRNNQWVVAGEIQDKLEYEWVVRTKTEMSIDNLSIEQNISEARAKQIIEECDIWHYPTSSEMFCFSVLEAMAAAKPVISYKLDAVKEFFDTDDWLADNPGDMLAKTEKLISLSPSQRDSIGLANYQNYLKHSGKNFAQRIMAEYQLALNSNKAASL